MEPALYIHIPFCQRKCIYCNFYSRVYDEDIARSFIDVIISQLGAVDRAVHSIYIGGGTPSTLDRTLLEKLLLALKGFAVRSGEFTVEANPESIDNDKMKMLFDLGVNRLSIGVQSFDDRKLKKLGRPHSSDRAREIIGLARKNGFSNISADLIFGVWGEGIEAWKKELDEASRLPITHISCYELTYEKSTPLFSALEKKSVLRIDDAITSTMYEEAIGMLGLGGFRQYEVSNFAKTGFESRHNMNYWENNPYIGLGPSAVSYIDGVRSQNIPDVKEYIDRFNGGKPLIVSKEKLSPVNSARETAAVKIRTREGIDFEWFRVKTGFDFCELEKKALPRLVEDGLIKYKRAGDAVTGVALKRKGFLFCDTVSSAFL